MNLFIALLVAGLGIILIIWRMRIAKLWFRGIAYSMKKYAPNSFFVKNLDFKNLESSRWIKFYSAGLIFAGVILILGAYTLIFGSF